MVVCKITLLQLHRVCYFRIPHGLLAAKGSSFRIYFINLYLFLLSFDIDILYIYILCVFTEKPIANRWNLM